MSSDTSSDTFPKPTPTGNKISDNAKYLLYKFRGNRCLTISVLGFIIGAPLLITGALGAANKIDISSGGNTALFIVGGVAMLTSVIAALGVCFCKRTAQQSSMGNTDHYLQLLFSN